MVAAIEDRGNTEQYRLLHGQQRYHNLAHEARVAVRLPQAHMGFIYMLISPSGKAYIGQTVHEVLERFRQHCWPSSSKTAIHDALMYYGPDAFKVVTLVEVPDELLDHYERVYIDAYGTFGKWGYNQTRGGDVNPMHDESVRSKCIATHAQPEVKAKHKKAMSVAMADPDRRKRISKTLSETLATPEARKQRSEQIAAAWKGNEKKRGASIKAGLNKPEARKKHVEALQRIGKDPAVREKRSRALKAYWAAKRAAAPPPRE